MWRAECRRGAEGLSVEEQQKIKAVFGNVFRDEVWKYPNIRAVEQASIEKVGNSFKMQQLQNLTDSGVLYRLPKGFPVMDFFNPPNNCFSCGVGGHSINFAQAKALCQISKEKQINYVYVTPSSNFALAQHWQRFEKIYTTRSLGKFPVDYVQKLSSLVQFCMRFKNY